MGEVTHEAAAAVGVVPAVVEALALEGVPERERRLGRHRPGERRIGDDLVPTGVVSLIQGTRDDPRQPSRPERRTWRLRHPVGLVSGLAGRRPVWSSSFRLIRAVVTAAT